MAWVEFHGAKIKRLKKFSDMRRMLNLSTVEALGLLGSFWGEAIELAEDGDITRWSPDYLCDLTGLKLNPERVWSVLLTTGWIDKTEDGLFLIHDWMEYAKRYLELRYRTNNAEKLAQIAAKHEKTVVSQTVVSPPNQTIPNQPNQPNQTKPDLKEILSQNEVLLSLFSPILREKVLIYLDRVAKKNKSKVLSDGRKNTLLLELTNSKSLCNNDQLFGEALEGAISRDACCIGYINAIIKNKKTQRPR